MNNARAAKHNARLALSAQFLSNFAFILPIWLLYSVNELHLSAATATVVFMCVWFTGGILEIPTGALADRLGRKRVFIIGSLLLSIYPVAYALELPLILLIPCCLLSGLGQALQSGALLPLVHKSYEEAKLGQKAYTAFMSNTQMAGFISRALSGASGAALYSFHPKLAFFAMSVVAMFGAILGLFLHDEKITEKTATNREHIKKTIALMRHNEVILSLLVSFVLFSLIGEVIWTGYQLFYENDGQSAFTIGVLFSIVAVCSAAGAYAIRHLFAKLHPLRLIQMWGIGMLVTAILLNQPLIWLRLVAIVPMGIMSGTVIGTLNSAVQQVVANRYHSTALSVVNLLWYGTYGIGSVCVGVLFTTFGIATTRSILLVWVSVVSVVVLVRARTLSNRAKAYRIQMPELTIE
ncbi:MAG TPA: MFS transporter [Verrucomicrobiae bacterium]|nr:MFS transporter [Verrucomicrobiae bacterium]